MFTLFANKYIAGGTKEPTKYLEFECPQCLRTYHSKPLLKQHMLIHGEKKFLCSKCGKSFFTQSTLYEHAKVFIYYYIYKKIY